MGALLLVHSPLLGPSSMARLAAAAHREAAVHVPDLTPAVDGPSPRWPRYVETALAAADDAARVVVVGHSGAGVYLPLIGAGLGDRLASLMFVDAVIPPVEGVHRTSPQLLGMLDEHTEDGRLARWLDWWPAEVIEAVAPDPGDRSALVADMPSVPRDLYDEPVPLPASWSAGPCGYLQLSAAYAEDRRIAAERSWPTSTLDSTHLALFTSPVEVLDAVRALQDRIDR